VDYFNHFVHILVRFRQFFKDPVSGFASHQNAARFELALLLANILSPTHGSAAHQAASPVTDAAKGLVHRTLPAGEHPRRGAHATGNEYRLPDLSIRQRNLATSGRKSAGVIAAIQK